MSAPNGAEILRLAKARTDAPPWRLDLDSAARTLEALRQLDRAPTPAELADAKRTLDAVGASVEPSEPSTIQRAWGPLPLAYVTEPAPARRWLLRHPTKDGKECAPGAGDGMLPLGKAGLLSADGGVGKTHAAVQLAMSIVTARDWLGYFAIGHEARVGRVLLLLAEEDAEEIHRRMFNVAESMRLTRADRETVADRVVVLGLAGSPVGLLHFDRDGRGTPTRELEQLRELVATGGPWSLICFDPLARWAGPAVETDNAAATAFVQAAESFCAAPGGPTVLVTHHSSQASVRAGTPDSRGVTGLRNGFRWEATLKETEAGGVAFRQSKSNYSHKWRGEDLALVRGPGGELLLHRGDRAVGLLLRCG